MCKGNWGLIVVAAALLALAQWNSLFYIGLVAWILIYAAANY